MASGELGEGCGPHAECVVDFRTDVGLGMAAALDELLLDDLRERIGHAHFFELAQLVLQGDIHISKGSFGGLGRT